MKSESDGDLERYALEVANGSYEWYRTAAIKSRFYHRTSIVLTQLLAAAIPVAAVLNPANAVIPAVMGGLIVVLTSLRSIFLWQENYLRFSSARESVEGERRAFRTGVAPYDVLSTRHQSLVSAITRIERDEMGVWTGLASAQRTDIKTHKEALPAE